MLKCTYLFSFNWFLIKDYNDSIEYKILSTFALLENVEWE